jgi:hypothetical protein
MGSEGGNLVAELDLSGRISELLLARRRQLPQVQGEIARWREIDQSFVELSAALDALRRHPSVPPDDALDLTIPHLSAIRTDIAEVIEQLGAVAARFSRDTVNIGVSGSARVGKSTLLQSISGLTDQQIPTGRDIPVTAVRSRIYHSRKSRQAFLRMHSQESFLSGTIEPYHAALRFAGVPASLEEFRSWSYPEKLNDDRPAGDVALLVRLREMQGALWSYEADLGGGDKIVPLEELRPYVAYPTSQERSSQDRAGHRYLAVRDARIECPFPNTEVEQLGIIDLPGLGEIAADAERQHVTGLRHDVDVVLLVKRATDGLAFWSASDAQALNLLDQARGAISNRGDFVSIVINAQDAVLAEALRADIRRQVNDGQDDRYFTVLETDAAEPASVTGTVLSPLLRTLADRLPVMDVESLAGASAGAEEVAARIRLDLSDLDASLRQLRSAAVGAIEDLDLRATALHENLAVSLRGLVIDFEQKAAADEDDPGYIAAIDSAYDAVRTWVAEGFGIGEEEWCERALRSFRVDLNTTHFAGAELNRIRVEISGRFAALDDFFTSRVEEARRDVGAVLKAHFGVLLTDVADGSPLLRQAAALLADASEPCPTLKGAIELLLGLRLEYRTQLHPRVRRQLDSLNIQVTEPLTGRPISAIVTELTPDGARELYKYVTQQARQAAWETKQALLAEKVTPLMVTWAAVEQVEDSLIRSGQSGLEFKRFARSYRDELWPGVYSGLTEGSARYARVMRVMRSINEKLPA